MLLFLVISSDHLIQKNLIKRKNKTQFISGGGTTRPLPWDGGAEELRRDPTVGPYPKVWTIGQE